MQDDADKTEPTPSAKDKLMAAIDAHSPRPLPAGTVIGTASFADMLNNPEIATLAEQARQENAATVPPVLQAPFVQAARPNPDAKPDTSSPDAESLDTFIARMGLTVDQAKQALSHQSKAMWAHARRQPGAPQTPDPDTASANTETSSVFAARLGYDEAHAKRIIGRQCERMWYEQRLYKRMDAASANRHVDMQYVDLPGFYLGVNLTCADFADDGMPQDLHFAPVDIMLKIKTIDGQSVYRLMQEGGNMITTAYAISKGTALARSRGIVLEELPVTSGADAGMVRYIAPVTKVMAAMGRLPYTARIDEKGCKMRLPTDLLPTSAQPAIRQTL